MGDLVPRLEHGDVAPLARLRRRVRTQRGRVERPADPARDRADRRTPVPAADRRATGRDLPAPRRLLRLGALPVDEVDGQLREEPAGRVVRRSAPGRAHDGARDVQALLGAGEADVREATLLLQLRGIAEGALVGEDPVLETGQEHHRELQALRGVQRHEGDDARVGGSSRSRRVVGRGVGDLVGVRDQGHPLEEGGQPRQLGLVVDGCRVVRGVRGLCLAVGLRIGSRARGLGCLLVGELARHRHELGEVLHAGLVLRVVQFGDARLELGQVAAAGEHRLEHDVGALARGDHLGELVDHRDEGADRRQRARRDARRPIGLREGLPEGDALLLGVRGDHRLRPVADAAARGVEDAAQRDLVGRIHQDAQVGERVLDLGTLVEAHPADHLVRGAHADEHLLEHPRLGVRAVEHRDVGGPRAALARQLADAVGDESRLVALVVGHEADDLLAVAGLRPQPLVLAAPVAGDHRVRSRQDRLGRAVVLLEHHGAGVGEVGLEVHDVADVRAAERVDRLVGVADHHELRRLDPHLLRVLRVLRIALVGHRQRVAGGVLRVVAAQLVHEGVLRVVGVLVLIHQHVPEASAIGLAHLGEGLEEPHRRHDEVVEVQRVGIDETSLVERVRLRVGPLDVAGRLVRAVVGILQLVLRVGDPPQHRPRGELLGVELELLADQRHEASRVGRVVDREGRLDVEPADLAPQDAYAGRVERGHPHDPGAAADQILDALAHLGGGLVGEGDRQDRPRMGAALADQPRDATGQHAGLARSGARDDQKRRTGVLHGLALGLVQAVEQLLDGRSGRAGGAAGLGVGGRLAGGCHRVRQPTVGL